MFILVVVVVVEALNGGTTAGRDTATTVASQRGRARFSEGFFERHPALVGHLRVLSITNASAANGQDVVAPVPPLSPGTSGDDGCVSMPPPAVGSLSSSSSAP